VKRVIKIVANIAKERTKLELVFFCSTSNIYIKIVDISFLNKRIYTKRNRISIAVISYNIIITIVKID